MAIKTFVLAAGLGTRLRPYTNTLPKPAIPFMGIPLLGYALYLSDREHFKNIIINTHVFANKLQTCASALNRDRMQIEYSHESAEPLGSGGALFGAKRLLTKCSDFFVINGDTVFIPKNRELLNGLRIHHQNTKSLCTLVVSEDPFLVQHFNPIWVNKLNQLVGVGDKPSVADIRPVHYVGIKIFNERIFKYVPSGVSNIFLDVLLPAIKKGEVVSVVPELGFWWETGNFDSFFKATKDAIKLIHEKKDQSFFEDVYKWAHRSFDFKITKKDTDFIFLNSSSSIPLKNIKSSAFIDTDTTCSPDIVLENIIINKDLHVEESSSNKMFIKDIK